MESIIKREILDVVKKCGFKELNEIQREAIPLIKSGKNVLVVSPTGSGKTEAAILPVLEKIYENRPPAIYSIYLTPLRSLNRDLLKRLKFYCKNLGISISVRHGDTPRSERNKMVISPSQIIITTPETLNVMLSGKKLRELLKNVRVVIIDEVHELAGNERGYQLTLILERLRNIAGNFQRIGLSATISNDTEIADFIAGGNDISVVRHSQTKRCEYRVVAGWSTFSETLEYSNEYRNCISKILEEIDSSKATLVFTNTRALAEELGRIIKSFGRKDVGVHHGSLSKELRVESEEKFKIGSLKALICTSSLELGIDIGHVDKVIQFNSPRQVMKFIQRVGRASHRLNEVSKGIVVGYRGDELEEAMIIARMALNNQLERIRIRLKPKSVLVNQLLGEVWCSKKVSLHYLYETFTRSYVFKDMSMDELKIIVDFLSKIKLIRYDGEHLYPTKRTREYFYENISMIPDENTYDVVNIEGKRIGMLDELYVSELEPGDIFTLSGRAWRTLEIKDDRIIVEEVDYPSYSPIWIGEEIPVDHAVASELGKVRRENVIESFVDEIAKNKINKWRESSLFDDSTISYHINDGEVILLGCFGTKVALALAFILSAYLGYKYGAVEYKYNTYFIYIKLSKNARTCIEEIREILSNAEHIEDLIRIACKNSPIVNDIFIYVARKFGVMRKDADVREININKLKEIYYGTILYDEVVEKFIHDRIDIESTKEIIKKIRENKIKFIRIQNLDEIRKYYLTNKESNILTEDVLERVLKRLLEEEILQICLSCGHLWHTPVKEVSYSCRVCGGTLLGIAPKYRENELNRLRNLIKSKDKILEKANSSNTKKIIDEMLTTSYLLRVHGYKAAMCIAGRGIGVRKATSILKIPYKNDLELVRRIIEAEIEYAKTRKYWDIL